MALTKLPSKDPGETVDVSYIFGNELAPGETIVGVTSTCTVFSAMPVTATDPSPTSVLVGTPSVASTSIQRVYGGLDANVYEILGTGTTNLGRVLVRKGLLPVSSS